LAEQFGAHLSHINRIETGKYNPSLEVVQKLATVFDVTIDY
jgi:DNA-binding XRE family transcriptional regulator